MDRASRARSMRDGLVRRAPVTGPSYDGPAGGREGPDEFRAPGPAQWVPGPVWADGCHTRRSTATTLPRMVASSPGMGW